ncbi:hypothetical protein CYA_1377 [Synechococcus sp. JA-3-3Ab]|nr:hypothetical protein CYA_1377 [Synechococcus sp. JA-3-3Ab]
MLRSQTTLTRGLTATFAHQHKNSGGSLATPERSPTPLSLWERGRG